MITENFKTTIRSHWRDFYPADKHGGIICPICGNGSGESGTGIGIDKSSSRAFALKCMKCGFSGDIINLIALDNHWDNNKDFIKIVSFASDRLKIEVNKSELAAINAEASHAPKNARVDYSDFFKIAATGLEQTDYWKKRGLSLETVRHFNCGYLPRWRSPKVSVSIPCSPRFIIPIWQFGYLARDVRPIEEIADPKSRRYIKQKAGTVNIFNAKAIGESEILFAVEGEIDAMSIFDAGFKNVCALGSISMVRKFLAAVKNATKKPRAIIVALDNEDAEPVKKARADLERGLAKLDIACLDGTSVSGNAKDPNDLLLFNRKALIENCTRLMEQAKSVKPAINAEMTLTPRSTKSIIADCPVDLVIPDGFVFNTRGVFTEKNVPACLTPIVPVRIISNARSGTEKIELAVRQHANSWRSVITDASNIADSNALVKLSNLGIETYTGAAKHLTQFLAHIRAENRNVIERIIEFDQPGWTDDQTDFILPYISPHSLGDLAERFEQRGSLQAWLAQADQIRNFKNQMARVILAAAFTAPLLRIIGSRTFGLFVYGTSGYGKSASMRFALSTWGNPSKMAATFNSTRNSYEKIAMYSNDLPMMIDEKQALVAGDNANLASIIYQLAEEEDRGRMRRDTSLREKNRWRLIFLANGESSLLPDSITSGAHNRVIEIALRDNDRIFPSEEYAARIHRFVDKNFGLAGEVFMKEMLPRVRAGVDGVIDTFNAVMSRMEKYSREYMPEHAAHLAKLITGDVLVSQILFNEARPLESSMEAIVGEMMPRLPKRRDLDDSRRAWQFVTHHIITHRSAFVIKGIEDDETAKYIREAYGRMEFVKVDREGEDPEYELERVLIFPETMAKILREGQFNAKKCMNDFVDRGWIPFDGKGYPRVRWMGKRQRMIVIDGDKLND